VLQARFNLVIADPLLLGDSVKFIGAEVRPVVENLPGSLGMSLYTNPELGVAVLESFWTSSCPGSRTRWSPMGMPRSRGWRRARGSAGPLLLVDRSTGAFDQRDHMAEY
jgi:hypothetical protein